MISKQPKSQLPPQSQETVASSNSIESDESGDPDPSDHQPNELSLLNIFENVFCTQAYLAQNIDYSDDCASFSLNQDQAQIVVTTDAICEGTHFDCLWDSFEDIGAQAAVANLSDLASCAAQARALFWSLSLPPQLTLQQIKDLAKGFERVASHYHVPVLGGNTVIRAGKLEIHVTAIGEAYPKAVKRQGAQVGDLVYVTGYLGSRALGYLDPNPETRSKRHQWYPHLNEATLIRAWGKATAMMDISDGLLLDANRLAQVNQIHIDLKESCLPIDPELQDHPMIRQAALSGGEDYILLFTAPPQAHLPKELAAFAIGTCLALKSEQHSSTNPHIQKSKTQVTIDGQYIEKLGHLYRLEGQS